MPDPHALSAAVAEHVVPWHATTRRRPSDAVRLLLATMGIATIVVTLQPDDTRWPSPFAVGPQSGFARGVLTMLGIAALGLVAWLAIRSKTGRFFRDVAAGSAIAALIGGVATRLGVGPDGVTASAGTASVGATALLSAILAAISAARPYGGHLARRNVSVLATLLVAAAYLGGVLSIGAIGIAVLTAWGAAAALHLVLGSPRSLHTSQTVGRDAAALGITINNLTYDHHQLWGITRLVGTDPAGQQLTVSVYGRDAADAQFLSRFWRVLWYRNAPTVLTASRVQQAEHVAFTTLMAERAGVGVPHIVAAGQAPLADDAMVIHLSTPGRSLADLPPDEVTDAMLAGIWHNLACLHRAGLSHGAVQLHSVTIAADGTSTFNDLGSAVLGSAPNPSDLDNAQLLVLLSILIGPTRSTASALQALGSDRLVAVLPLLQPSAMPPDLRRTLGKAEVFKPLRLAASEAGGVSAPELAQMHRFSVGDVVMLVASAFGINLILSQIGSVDGLGPALAEANWAWILLALLIGASTSIAAGVSYTGAVSAPLPFRPVILLQIANLFTGLVGGTVALTATNIRFAQRRGLNATLALSAGILMSLAGFVVQAVTLVAGFWAYSPDIDLGRASGSLPGWVLPVAISVFIAVALTVAIPRFRTRVLDRLRPSAHTVFDNLRSLVHSPRRLFRLVGGAALVQVLYATALWCTLAAFGVYEPIVLLLAISTLAALAGGLAPVPGGLGVIEATLVAGLTAAGVEQTTASATVLTYRLVTAYLPPAWGWASLVWLRRHEYL